MKYESTRPLLSPTNGLRERRYVRMNQNSKNRAAASAYRTPLRRKGLLCPLVHTRQRKYSAHSLATARNAPGVFCCTHPVASTPVAREGIFILKFRTSVSCISCLGIVLAVSAQTRNAAKPPFQEEVPQPNIVPQLSPSCIGIVLCSSDFLQHSILYRHRLEMFLLDR